MSAHLRSHALRRGTLAGVLTLACGSIVSVSQGRAQTAKAITVAAASDLKFVLEDLAQRFAQNGAPRPELIFGSSGNLARQIQQGAPYDLFMSADEALIDRLLAAKLIRDRGAVYGVGYLVLIALAGSMLSLPSDFKSIVSLLPQVERFAIANPEHAPYGRAAAQAIKSAGLHDALAAKLVLGENVVAATQFVLTGAAQLGITGQALVRAPALASKLKYSNIDSGMHAPLIMRMALIGDASAAARAFYQFLQGDQARSLFQRYGFGQSS